MNIKLYFQRLCEDLEYSDLLDKANDYDDPYERMVSSFVFDSLYAFNIVPDQTAPIEICWTRL